MAHTTSPVPTSPELFRLCADHKEREEYWTLFVERFNAVLVRTVTLTWRRYGAGRWIPESLAEDLLQEIYAKILQHDARFLRNFQGTTESEAHAYLIQTATNQILSYLRAQATQKRMADEISLDGLLEGEGDAFQPTNHKHAPRTMQEWELVMTLRRLYQGKNADRDILILLLYAKYGYSPAEIARMPLCDLKESSVANLLAQMKKDLKKYLTQK